jgi:hypothetical protein
MFIEFTTTITHRITIGEDGLDDIQHGVDVDATSAEGLPTQLIYAISKAGCEATIRAIDAGTGKVVVEGDPDD